MLDGGHCCVQYFMEKKLRQMMRNQLMADERLRYDVFFSSCQPVTVGG